MVKYCIIKNCKNEWRKDGDVTFHSFPKDPKSFNAFVNAIPEELRKHVSKYSYICSNHFSDEAYQPMVPPYFKRILKKTAIPTVFNYNEDFSPTSTITLAATSTSKESPHHNPVFLDDPTQLQMLQQFSQSCSANEVTKKDVGSQTVENKFQPTDTERRLRNRIKILQKRLNRREIRLKTMASIIQHLKNNGKCSDAVEDVLKSRFGDFTLEILTNELKNSNLTHTRKRYSDHIKSFALTRYFYSPKAYNFIRTKLNLPHSSLLRKWLNNCNCTPGFMTEIFTYLENEVKINTCLQDVSLIFDSMAIRSQIIYDVKNDKYRGYVDYGNILHVDSEELAKEVLVLQIVSFTKKLKIPIAFFFVNKIHAELQCQIINNAIITLQGIGITVRSITCDGCATNLKTLELLGCNIFTKEMVTSFKPASVDSHVHCILDPCHMIKLTRNTFAETHITSPKGEISFNFIKKLHDLQEAEDLKISNRLSSAHINYFNKKMNVRLAAQVISSGVADALDYLRTSGDPRFAKSEATVEFLRIFDKLFDIMNSRNPFGRGFKAPIYPHNIELIKEFFVKSKDYIMSIRINGDHILKHSRKTFALGFLLNMDSFINLAHDLLTKSVNPLKYVLTYKCSQDHLELYFSCIRSRGGWNDTPNCLQFMWALRKMLFRNSVKPSVNANSLDDFSESAAIFEFRSPKRCLLGSVESTNVDSDETLKQLTTLLDRISLTPLQENILYYITGVVVNKILSKLLCPYCRNFLLEEKDHHDHEYAVDVNRYSSFASFVNRGKLCFPSKTVFEIVKCTEKAFRAEINLGLTNKAHFKRNIMNAVFEKFSNMPAACITPSHPPTENTEFHEIHILKDVTNIYANIRILTYMKKATERYIGDRLTLRHRLHKAIFFANV